VLDLKKLPLVSVMVFVLMSVMTTAAHAQWKPRHTVELVVAAGAGGGNDKTARLLAKLLQERKLVTTPMVVVNKPGAGGLIAQNYLNTQQGDGHRLMITNPAIITNPITGIGTASYRDITPVAQLFTEYVVLITRPASDIKSIKDVLERLRRDPSSLTLGVAPAVGAGTHIGIALAAKEAGIDPSQLRVVPYSTSGDVLTALMGGHIDLMSSTPINVLPQLENATVRALAITGPKRLGGRLADVPTFKEHGVDAEFGNWRGVVGARGMTAEQVAYWDGVFAQLVLTPEWQAEVRDQLSDAIFMASGQSKAFLDRENQRLTRVLADLGLTKK
jgi:putative tricarboxylic transport membrane protein